MRGRGLETKDCHDCAARAALLETGKELTSVGGWRRSARHVKAPPKAHFLPRVGEKWALRASGSHGARSDAIHPLHYFHDHHRPRIR